MSNSGAGARNETEWPIFVTVPDTKFISFEDIIYEMITSRETRTVYRITRETPDRE